MARINVGQPFDTFPHSENTEAYDVLPRQPLSRVDSIEVVVNDHANSFLKARISLARQRMSP